MDGRCRLLVSPFVEFRAGKAPETVVFFTHERLRLLGRLRFLLQEGVSGDDLPSRLSSQAELNICALDSQQPLRTCILPGGAKLTDVSPSGRYAVGTVEARLLSATVRSFEGPRVLLIVDLQTGEWDTHRLLVTGTHRHVFTEAVFDCEEAIKDTHPGGVVYYDWKNRQILRHDLSRQSDGYRMTWQ
jgi:hypothetical protein